MNGGKEKKLLPELTHVMYATYVQCVAPLPAEVYFQFHQY